MAKEVKKQTADEAVQELNKLYGKGTVIRTTKDELNDCEVISTGSLYLDKATGIGGVPRGRMIEIVGPESSGKTTLATHIGVNGQKIGKVAVVDIEQTYDLKYAKALGLKLEDIFFAQPENGEQSFDIIKKLASTGEFSVIILDSVAANIPKESFDGETGHQRMARLAALNSLEAPKLAIIASKYNCLIVLLNQFRNNIGGYGNPLKPAGGDSIGYYCSMRLQINKSNEIEDHRNLTKVKIFKNKVSMPFGTAEFYIDWGKGINRKNEVLDAAVEQGLIIKAGAGWYTVNETKIQGDVNVLQFFEDNPEFYELLEKQVKEKL